MRSGSARPLRVGLVCPYSLESPGGVQNHVLGLADFLAERGHSPQVLAPGALAADALRPLDPRRFTSAGSAVPVRYNGSVAKVSFGPLTAGRVRRWLRVGRFDLLHIHEPVTPSIALLALWAAEQPVVGTFHAATPRSRSLRLAGTVLRTAVDKLDARIAVSETARQVVRRHLGTDATVVPNGIHFADFARTASPGLSGVRRRLLFLGRTDEPRKGLDLLLDALPAIRRTEPDLEVVVAGEGHQPLPPGCRRVGRVSEAEKVALLSTADVFVAPQRARESFGIVLVEAMASGVPVVASDLAPFVDLLGPTSWDSAAAGTVFAAGDSAALARAVIDQLRRPDPARTGRARRRARRYDWSAVGAQIEQVYRTVLTTGPAATDRQRAG
ncbi:MAG TPA: glycosyltransferase family 4 protein [Propionibacteriaceae bacterium]|nr:glycosyltransferase family 4 protein [Propionibacteriaceae bacterium]